MTDIKTSEERSYNMARIKGKDTKPEVFIRKMLYARGYRYRKNANGIPGHPDLWLSRYNTALFVNGCFWHRHQECKYSYMPKSRVEFWKGKFDNNIRRDAAVKEKLKSIGAKTLIIWECTVKKMYHSEEMQVEVIGMIERFLESQDLYLEI